MKGIIAFAALGMLAATGCRSTSGARTGEVVQAVAVQPASEAAAVVPAVAIVEPTKSGSLLFDSPFSSGGSCSH
jgi:hypothetical protein